MVFGAKSQQAAAATSSSQLGASPLRPSSRYLLHELVTIGLTHNSQSSPLSLEPRPSTNRIAVDCLAISFRLDMSAAPSDNDAPLGGVQPDPNRVSMLMHGTSDQPASPEEDEVPVGSPHENIAAVVRPSAIVECEGNEDTGDGAVSLAEEVAGQKQQAAEAGNIEEEGDAQQGADDDDDDGSEYSYEYCDSDADDDGFLIPAAAPAAVASTEEEVLEIARSVSRLESDTAASSSVPETNPKSALEKKQKWKEPTRAAVNMSLRAEKEKTGGRRRLASDLYKIMMVSALRSNTVFRKIPCSNLNARRPTPRRRGSHWNQWTSECLWVPVPRGFRQNVLTPCLHA